MTTLTVAIFVAAALFIAALVWAFHHDHTRGHCGYSGCQIDTPRNTP